MDNPILVDSDVMIDFLRDQPQAVNFINSHWNQIIIPALVVAELYAGVKGDQEEQVIDELIDHLRVVPITADIARSAGLYKRDYFKSHGVGLGDAVVAASAQSESAQIATLNVKHYPMIKGLRPAYRK